MDWLSQLSDIVETVDVALWGWPLIVVLLGTHIFTTIRTGFIQRKLGTGIKLSFSKNPESKDGVSQFSVLMTALAATIGTGNIVGVATALLLGGPGAIFWMWITGVFGISTKYAESYISIKYRVKDKKGNFLGGAMYALERGLKQKKLGKLLAILFAIFTIFASFGIGQSVQSNSLTMAITSSSLIPNASEIPTWIIAIIVTFLVGVVVLGGIKSITKVCSKLVPIMAIFYVAACLIIIFINYQYIAEALSMIVTSAFTGQAMLGGGIGFSISSVLHYGFKRGLFSNESGMGSAPIIAAQAATKNPARQALVSMTGTFWDTVVICAITGITLVTCLLANQNISDIYVATVNGVEGATIFSSGVALTTACFGTIPYFGPAILMTGIVLFAYSTMIGWCSYADRAFVYLFGNKYLRIYYIIMLFWTFIGCVAEVDLIWNLSDISNGLMTVPNCIAVVLLSGIVAKETKYFVYNKHLDEKSKDETIVVNK